MKKRTIALAAGGTAGHVFPAQALTAILSTKNEILFFTDQRGTKYFENQSQVKELKISNLTGNFIKKGIALLKLGMSILKCIYLLKTKKVKLAIGFGGLTSFPVLFGAKILKIPIILHEQNAVLGKANRFFLNDATLVATSYSETIGAVQPKKIIYTGNPIRSVIFDAKRRRTRITNEIHILVIGGSQGAKIMDEVVAKAMTSLPHEVQERISIWQQVRDREAIEKIYSASNIRSFKLSSFFEDIQQLMADSDLIITRAGASALSEIEHLKVPAIVIPMALAADNHQYHNASAYVKKDIGLMIEEKDLSIESLHLQLENLLLKNDLDKIRNTMRDCAENTSAQKLAVKINEVIINLRL